MKRLLPDAFIPLLDSLQFRAEDGAALLVELWGDTQCETGSNQKFVKPAVCLFQKRSTETTLAGFRKKLLQILRGVNHVADETIADAMLGCAVGAARSGSERAEFLESALAQTREAEVSHFFAIPIPATTKPIYFDGYRLGEIDFPVLTSRCNRAGSDYAQLNERKLAGRFTLQSPTFRQVIVDFLTPVLDSGLHDNSKAFRNLLLNYFERVSRQHFEFMWAHLARTQLLGAPFNTHMLDVQSIRSQLGVFAQRVTIYLEFSRKDAGYVVPEGGAIVFNQPGPDSEAFERFKEHRRIYALGDVGDSELGRTLLASAEFSQQAIRFLEAGRCDDAALYAMICLEHLFSEKEYTSHSVCTRTAALTFLRLAENYSDAERELRKLYEARSLFVHSGKSVTPAQAERLIDYAREALRSLLVLNMKPTNREVGFCAKWIKDLDFIIAGFEAGRTFENSFLAENGIFRL